MKFLFIVKVDTIFLFDDHIGPPPPILLNIEPILVNKSWARTPISLRQVWFCYLFIDPHLATQYSNIGV